eukprot:TRINITY_DN839_c0_g2_i2.p1 TRINITY_DN839_c0_g2~~TRINITY_DN839_c0_g2_i2.p1  ORF type:complete len:200 (-),score=26.78 TRINITY_DN839_c0_g2_i2:94-693(-)
MRMPITFSVFFLALFIVSAESGNPGLAGRDENIPRRSLQQNFYNPVPNIIQKLNSLKLTKFAQYLSSSGASKDFALHANMTRTATVLAPTDAAFNSISKSLAASLKQRPGLMKQIILFHILRDSHTAEDLAQSEIYYVWLTLDNYLPIQKFTVKGLNSPVVLGPPKAAATNRAKLVGGDAGMVDNIYILMINKVLLPGA